MAMNVRVELKFHGGNSRHDRERVNFILFRQFNRAVKELGLIHEMRERSSYEKPGDKKRRKKRQADRERMYAAAAAAAGVPATKPRQNRDRRNNEK